MILKICKLFLLAEKEQLDYLHNTETYQGAFHTIKCGAVKEFPLYVKFASEHALDVKGLLEICY